MGWERLVSPSRERLESRKEDKFEVQMVMEYLKEVASRDPIGRLLITVHRLHTEARMASTAKEVDLSDRDFIQAIAEAEWGGLLKREERDGGIYLVLTPQGQARAEAILRPST
jgi:hypothetical protein